MKGWLKLIIDIGPLALFFLLYKSQGLMVATGALIVSTAIGSAITYYYEKHLPLSALISTVLAVVMGGLTLLSGNSTFIKMKPTFLCTVLAIILLIGVWQKKGLLRYVLGSSITLTERGWHLLSLRWGLFFLLLAGLNEVIWRSFSEEIWVQYKVFGILPITFLFTLTQLPFIRRHAVSSQES